MEIYLYSTIYAVMACIGTSLPFTALHCWSLSMPLIGALFFFDKESVLLLKVNMHCRGLRVSCVIRCNCLLKLCYFVFFLQSVLIKCFDVS